MKRRTFMVAIAAAAAVAAGGVAYKTTKGDGFHPLLGRDDVDAIAGLVLRQEISPDTLAAGRRPMFVEVLGKDPTPRMLAQVPGAKPISAYPKESSAAAVVCSIFRLVTLAPLSAHATVTVLTGLASRSEWGGGDFGGGETRYSLVREGKAWRVVRRERLRAY
jgi:hypothetical protein